MKKTLVSLLILAAFAAIVFFAGWTQFAVPAGKYGVLVSKTGGVCPKPLVPGEFRWNPERLLPTNASILAFDLGPSDQTLTVSGILPSSDLYSKMLEGSPDFSWTVTLAARSRVSPAALPALVAKNDIRDQKALDAWIGRVAAAEADKAVRSAIEAAISRAAEGAAQTLAPGAGTVDPSRLAQSLVGPLGDSGIEVVSASAVSARVPDLSLYGAGSRAYAAYQERKRDVIEKTAVREADAAASETLRLERLERLGELLTKYPILIDYFAVTREDADGAIKTLKSLRQ